MLGRIPNDRGSCRFWEESSVAFFIVCCMAVGIHILSYKCATGSESALVSYLDCQYGALRLVGHNMTAGRLELYNGSRWGTICKDRFIQQDAQVACRQLGFSASGAESLRGGYSIGSGEIWITSVDCNGNESSLLDCTYSTDIGTCYHGRDVGISCPNSLHIAGKSADYPRLLISCTVKPQFTVHSVTP